MQAKLWMLCVFFVAAEAGRNCDSLKENSCRASDDCKWCYGNCYSNEDNTIRSCVSSIEAVLTSYNPFKQAQFSYCSLFDTCIECNQDPKCAWEGGQCKFQTITSLSIGVSQQQYCPQSNPGQGGPNDKGYFKPCGQIYDCNECLDRPDCTYCKDAYPPVTRKRSCGITGKCVNKPVNDPSECKDWELIEAQGCEAHFLDCVCDYSTCNNAGICIWVDGHAGCLCDPGYSGDFCQIEVQYVNIKIDDVMVTSGVQSWDNDVPLVAGKVHAIRVKVSKTNAVAWNAVQTPKLLFGFDLVVPNAPDIPVPGYAVNINWDRLEFVGYIPVGARQCNYPVKITFQDSFYSGAKLQCGNGNICSFTFQQVCASSVWWWVYRIKWKDDDDNIISVTDQELDNTLTNIQNSFPFKSQFYLDNFVIDCTDILPPQDLTQFGQCRDRVSSKCPWSKQCLGVLGGESVRTNPAKCADCGWAGIGSADGDCATFATTLKYGWAPSHELSHVLFRQHVSGPPDADSVGCGDENTGGSIDNNYPVIVTDANTNPTAGDIGENFNGRKYESFFDFQVLSPTKKEFMTYCDRGIGLYHWDWMLNRVGYNAGLNTNAPWNKRAATQRPADSNIDGALLTIDFRKREIVNLRFNFLPEATEQVSEQEADFGVQLSASIRRCSQTMWFKKRYVNDANAGPFATEVVQVLSIPWCPQITGVQIIEPRSRNQIASLQDEQTNALVVKVVEGTVQSNSVTLSIIVRMNKDSDLTIEYSNTGVFWIPVHHESLSSEASGNTLTFSFDANKFAATNTFRMRAVLSRNLTNIGDATDELIIQNHPPMASIESCEQVSNGIVHCSGTGFDADEYLDDFQFSWSVQNWFNWSFPMPTIGQGRTIEFPLPIGIHSIILRVTDSYGAVAVDYFDLTVVKSYDPPAEAPQAIDHNNYDDVAHSNSHPVRITMELLAAFTIFSFFAYM